MFIFFFAAFLLGFGSGQAFSGGKSPLESGNVFPDLPLKIPDDLSSLEYLGMKKNKPFHLKDLKADLVLVEIMNINCGSCRRQAPAYNKLYELIQSNPDIQSRVKMLSIASGNQEKYIRMYKKHFKVPYPVIADPQFKLYNAIGRTPTPLAVFLRLDHHNNRAVVADTHLGIEDDHQKIYSRMLSLLKKKIPDVKPRFSEQTQGAGHPNPPISEAKLLAEIVRVFFKHAEGFTNVKPVDLGPNEILYTSEGQKEGQKIQLFARVVSRKIPCDLCHDAHFLYIFDNTGKILDFVPLSLTKYGNEPWDKNDILKMHKQIVGKYVFNSFPFDAHVDAITSATITSSVLINSMNESRLLFENLKEKGLLQTNHGSQVLQ